MFVDVTGSHGCSDIVGVFNSEFMFQSLHDFRFNAADDFQDWSLGPNPAKSSSFFVDGTLLDVLIENLVVEFSRALSSDIVRKFSTLRLDDVTLTWRNVVGLRIDTLMKSILNSLLVFSRRILMVH